MKTQRIRWLLLGFVMLLMLFTFWYLYPKTIHHTFQAVHVQFNSGNPSEEEKVDVEIDGKIYHNPFDEVTPNTFKGRIEIGGEEIPVPKESRKLTISIFTGGRGYMEYTYEDNEEYMNYPYGSIVFNEDFSKFIIQRCSEEFYMTDISTCWNPENGRLIIAPAENREEAFRLASNLLKLNLEERK